MTTDPSANIQDLLASIGVDPGALTAAPALQASMTQEDIASALIASAKAASSPYNSPLPWWAQGLRSSLVSQQQFGSVYQAKEGLVYLGAGGIQQVSGQAPNKYASDLNPSSIPTLDEPADRDYAITATQAANLPYTWSEEEVADAMKRLKDAGIDVDSFDTTSNSLVSVWGSLVNRAAQTYALTDGKRKLTPWDVVDLYKKEADVNPPGPGDPNFNGTTTTTTRNVTEISEGEAWANIQSTLSNMLGRDPSDQETRDFTYRMNHMAATNPSISKTVTSYKNGTPSAYSTHTDPGFTSADVAQSAYDTALDDPDHAEYAAASTYWNAMMSALGPIGAVGG